MQFQEPKQNRTGAMKVFFPLLVLRTCNAELGRYSRIQLTLSPIYTPDEMATPLSDVQYGASKNFKFCCHVCVRVSWSINNNSLFCFNWCRCDTNLSGFRVFDVLRTCESIVSLEVNCERLARGWWCTAKARPYSTTSPPSQQIPSGRSWAAGILSQIPSNRVSQSSA